MQYVIVTPAKNEASYIGLTISSVIAQTIRPLRYIIVDDGSDDDTAEVVRSFMSLNPWIELVQGNSAGVPRQGGAKVVRAFDKGYHYLSNLQLDYDIIVKLDADLELPKSYFETIIKNFENEPALGMCGGYIMNRIGDKLIEEPYSDYHVRGAFKSVRRTCFEQIGGFKPIWNWDSIDQIEAMAKGWTTKVIDLPVIQFRPTSAAYSPKRQQMRDGYDAYCIRNNFALVLLRMLSRFFSKPYLFSGIYYLAGYFKAILNREPITISWETARYYNRFHTKRILSSIVKFQR